MTVQEFKARLSDVGFAVEAQTSFAIPRDPLAAFRRTTLVVQARAQCPTADVLSACDRLEKDASSAAAKTLVLALLSCNGKPGCPPSVLVSGADDGEGKPWSTRVIPIDGLCSAASWAATAPADPKRASEYAASAVASLGGVKVVAALVTLDAEAAKEVVAVPAAEADPVKK